MINLEEVKPSKIKFCPFCGGKDPYLDIQTAFRGDQHWQITVVGLRCPKCGMFFTSGQMECAQLNK